jgi:hypothetical protein
MPARAGLFSAAAIATIAIGMIFSVQATRFESGRAMACVRKINMLNCSMGISMAAACSQRAIHLQLCV